MVVSSATAGTYYFTFQASAGDRSTTGVLRADVVSVYDKHPVVPMLDVAYVPNGSPAVIDPLANDTDPAGSGLAVQSVGTAAGVTAALTDLHFAQIATQRPLADSITLPYSVFDGSTVASGEIRVVSVPAPERIPPPLVEPIEVTVRAGDAVTIPIDSYAASQDGSPLTVDVDPTQTAGLPGVAFATGTDIRYLAPAAVPTDPVVFGYTAVSGSSTTGQPGPRVVDGDGDGGAGRRHHEHAAGRSADRRRPGVRRWHTDRRPAAGRHRRRRRLGHRHVVGAAGRPARPGDPERFRLARPTPHWTAPASTGCSTWSAIPSAAPPPDPSPCWWCRPSGRPARRWRPT